MGGAVGRQPHWVVYMHNPIIELQTMHWFSQSQSQSWLRVPTSAFTFKTLLRHYAKQMLNPLPWVNACLKELVRHFQVGVFLVIVKTDGSFAALPIVIGWRGLDYFLLHYDLLSWCPPITRTHTLSHTWAIRYYHHPVAG